MGPDIFDLIVGVSMLFFTFRGVSNGFVVEAAGVFSLIAGCWAARAWNGQVAPYLSFISDPAWRPVIACIIIFIVVMLAVGFLARMLKKVLSFSFAGWLDTLAGLVFGFVKGAIIWTLIFIVLIKFFHDSSFLVESRLYPYFTYIIEQIKNWLPPDLAQYIGA